MSAINFTFGEVDNLRKNVKAYFKYHKEKIGYFKRLNAVQKYLYNGNDINEIFDKLIERCFWYLWVSNQICYSLQYKETINLFEQTTKDKFIPLSPKQLLKQFNSLEYNIDTNDGNRFIEPDFYEFYELIKTYLVKELLDPILYE